MTSLVRFVNEKITSTMSRVPLNDDVSTSIAVNEELRATTHGGAN